MSPELREEVELELAMLREHIGSIEALRQKVRNAAPDVVETMALGAFLHGFYNGIENAFKRIAIQVDGGPPRGESWHQELLERMTGASPNRPPVISKALARSLQDYLGFRHLFRNLYSYRLEWEHMRNMVNACEETLRRLESELDLFLKATEGRE